MRIRRRKISTSKSNKVEAKILPSKVVIKTKRIVKNEPLINIITRTSGRPNGFKRCHESIKKQTYKNIRHVVSIDNNSDIEYVKKYDVDYYFIDKEQIKKKPDIPDPKTGGRFIYNLYFNELFQKVNNGWIMILDDDDYLADENAIQSIANSIVNNTDMLIFQMKYPKGNTLPTIAEMGRKPKLARIGSPCIMVHSGIAKTIKWDGWKCGDFRYISQVWNKTNKKRWIKKPIVLLGSSGGFGLRKDIEIRNKPSVKKNKNQQILRGFRKKFESKGQQPNYKRYTKSEVLTIISSYNRYDHLTNIIDQLESEYGLEKNKIIVLNDKSTDIRYKGLQKKYPNITVLNNRRNNGKKRYWKSINTLLNEAKNRDFKYLIQLDDDFKLCNNFISNLIRFVNDNPNYVAYNFSILNSQILNKKRWGYKCYVDGGALYKYDAWKKLKFKLFNIPLSRWKHNPKLSSGVWHQVTTRLYKNFNNPILQTDKSYIKHEGYDYSVMNPNRTKQEKNKVKTKDFIDE